MKKLLFCMLFACLSFFSVAHAAPKNFCPKPKIIDVTPKNFAKKLFQEFKGMGTRKQKAALAFSFRRLWYISQGKGKKGIPARARYYRRLFGKATRKINSSAYENKAYAFIQKKKLFVYGMMKLKGKSFSRMRKHCFMHDTHKNFKFVERSFMLPSLKGKACEGLLVTDFHRKILFVDLRYPLVNPFKVFKVRVGSQVIEIVAWTKFTREQIAEVAKNATFRYNLLVHSKKIKDTAANRKNKAALVKKHKAFLDKDTGVFLKKHKEFIYSLGGYMFIPKTGSKPAYFGHLQIIRLRGRTFEILNSGVGRRIVANTHAANMNHIAR